MKAVIALAILRAAFAVARCDDGPCDDPAVLDLETSDCQKYHIFSARGSNAPIPGHAGELIRQVCKGLKDCGYENIDYPAHSGANGPGAWCESAHTGALNGQEQLTDYNKRCPDSNLIIIGFSQGGSVALDILGGGGDADVFGCHQEENDALDRSKLPGSKIVAAASFGPTVRTAGQNFTVKGGKDFNGTAPRNEKHLEGLYPYSNILREWCNAGDPICAKDSNPSDVKNHLNYFQKYTEEASAWIIKTTKKSTGNADEGDDEELEQVSATTSTHTSTRTAASASATQTETQTAKGVQAHTTQAAVTSTETGAAATLMSITQRWPLVSASVFAATLSGFFF